MPVSMGSVADHPSSSAKSARAAAIVAVILGEIALIVWCYSFDFGGFLTPANESFCNMFTTAKSPCHNIRFLMYGIPLGGIAFLTLLLTRAGRGLARPAFDLLLSHTGRPVGIAINLIGLALVLLPYGWAVTTNAAVLSNVWLASLALGAFLLPLGVLLWRAPFNRWLEATSWQLASMLFLAGVALPFFSARMGMQAWSQDTLQQTTFKAVVWVLEFFDDAIVHDVSRAYVSIGDFAVLVGHPCAGFWGIVLSCGTILGFGILMRDQLRLDRVVLLLPLVALISWVFNVLRVVFLLLIGAHISPELAVDGFHSYAGWVSFMAVAAMMIIALDRWSWMQVGTPPQAHVLSFFEDPTVAQILPFLLWLCSSLGIAAIYVEPAFGYIWKVAIAGVPLLLLWRALPTVRVTHDLVAVGLGVAIAAVWIIVMNSTQDHKPLTTLWGDTIGLQALAWVAIRLLGTAILVPIIEEFFFRGYLQTRLSAVLGKKGPILATVIVSVIFASLHQVFWIAFVAGVVFTFVAARRGKIWDAVLCHATANLVIGVYAIATDNISLI